MSDGERRRIGAHLAWLFAVAITGLVATTLIVITRDLASLWPLYIVPIVIASHAYHVSGAALSVATTAALVTLLAYSGMYAAPPIAELAVGLAACALSGAVIGVQARRYQRQADLLALDSTRDTVTGAWTADRIEQRLAEEVRRCARYDANCVCMLVDLPGLAEFHRKFGRIKADLLLVRVAEILRLVLRETDLVGRHAASGFAAILPATDSAHAALVAARVEEAVTATEFEGDALEPTTHVAVAVAFAEYPRDATSAAQLLSVARTRLGEVRTATSRQTVDAELLGNARLARAPEAT